MRFCTAQNFLSEWGSVALPEKQETKDIEDGMHFGPAEIGVRHDTSGIPKVKEKSGDGVGHGGALRAEDAVFANAFSGDFEGISEI